MPVTPKRIHFKEDKAAIVESGYTRGPAWSPCTRRGRRALHQQAQCGDMTPIRSHTGGFLKFHAPSGWPETDILYLMMACESPEQSRATIHRTCSKTTTEKCFPAAEKCFPWPLHPKGGSRSCRMNRLPLTAEPWRLLLWQGWWLGHMTAAQSLSACLSGVVLQVPMDWLSSLYKDQPSNQQG